MAQGAVSPELRAKLARRFEDKPAFQAWLARNGEAAPVAEEAAPAPWDVIHVALVRGQAGGLNAR
ncbi:hypothetical protein OKC48_15860 [Methylorubrum extorquens]|uniref:hypothetical protein n=1 Tax=Methylorubrum extorquens TaxID=408 RepID=UPI0022387B13|nr:hypothetical protein [Methylorubrum extorquens]UYW24750.1 hypothetical protein OKC48_15860 [Methylorubrum extorquens]